MSGCSSWLEEILSRLSRDKPYPIDSRELIQYILKLHQSALPYPFVLVVHSLYLLIFTGASKEFLNSQEVEVIAEYVAGAISEVVFTHFLIPTVERFNSVHPGRDLTSNPSQGSFETLSRVTVKERQAFISHILQYEVNDIKEGLKDHMADKLAGQRLLVLPQFYGPFLLTHRDITTIKRVSNLLLEEGEIDPSALKGK